MSREWQQTRFKELVMPDAVYYQSIWAVRDLQRMENRLKELDEDIADGGMRSTNLSIVSDHRQNYDEVRPTEKRALEKANLETRVEAINSAMNVVPPVYRTMIMDNIVLKANVKGFPNKLWRIWKQRFLFNVAKNLSLM